MDKRKDNKLIPLMDIGDAQHFLEQEIKAENYAVPFVYGVTYSDCLRMNGIDTEIIVDGKKIQAHRIYGAWNDFLLSIGEVTGEITTTTTKTGKVKEKPVATQSTRFTGVADTLIKKMVAWAMEKYPMIATEHEKEWLETVIRFVAYRRIMENKYHRWITQQQGFADPTVATTIAEAYRFKYEMPSIARLIHEKILHHKGQTVDDAKDWEKKLAQDIITGLFDLLRVDRLRLLPPVDLKLLEEGDQAV
jgi:hypothetical protein